MSKEDPAAHVASPQSDPSKIYDPETLSRKAKTTFILSASIFLAISIYCSTTGTLLLPVILAPTALFLSYRRSLPHAQRGSLEIISWAYLGTATISTVILIIVQGVLAYLVAWLLFQDRRDWFVTEFQTVSHESQIRDDAHRAQRAEFAARPAYWIFMLVMTLVLAGLCEEMQKYISIALAVRSRSREVEAMGNGGKAKISKMEYLVYGAAAGLSYATIEMYMFLVAGAANSKASGELARTLAERLCIGMAAHSLCGLSTALGMIRRDFGKEKHGMLRVILRSALCHGTVNFGLMAFCAVRGDIGWIHPEDTMGTLTCLTMSASGIGLLGWLVWEDLREMDLKVK